MAPITRILIIIGSVLTISLILGNIASFLIPEAFWSAISSMFSYLGLFSFILPNSTIVTIITLTLTFHASLLSYRGIKWILNYFKPF